MQRRIQVTDGHRTAFQRLVHALEVALLHTAAAWPEPLGAAPRCSERIISRMSAIRVASKNMCSVRHRPMPSAPNFTACSRVVRGIRVGADAAACGPRQPSPSGGAKSPETEASTVGIASAYTLPVEPSMEIQSPSWNDNVADGRRSWLPRRSCSVAAAGDAAGAHAAGNDGRVGGHAAADGQDALRMRPCPRYPPERSPDGPERPSRRSWRHAVASSAVKYTMPQAAPGEAARPVAMTFAFFSAAASNCGCSRESSCLGSTLQDGLFAR